MQASAADTSLALALLSRDPVAARHTYTSITPASHQLHTTLRTHRIQVTQLVIAQPAVTVVTARTAPAGAGRARQGRRRGAESFLIRSNIWLLVTFVHYM